MNQIALGFALEVHCLQPQFRYNHVHKVGDVTLWDLYATLHAVPPLKTEVDKADDARMLYRLSCKGPPSEILPRVDAQAWLDKHVALGYRTPLSILT